MTRSTRAKPFSTLHLNKLLAKEREGERIDYIGVEEERAGILKTGR